MSGSTANTINVNVVVLGAGPGGYTAAFRAADLGLSTAIVERHPTLGGVCLNVGCIPSKALLHTASSLGELELLREQGVEVGDPVIDVGKLRSWKDGVVGKLTGGLAQMAKRRKVQVVHGNGVFTSAASMEVTGEEETTKIRFTHAIIASGSRPVSLPAMPDDSRIITSTGALALEDVPPRLLVIGGGIIGLEMATVYSALGSRVTVVELTGALIPGCDKDHVRPLQKLLKKKCEAVYLSTRVTGATAAEDGIEITFEGDKAPAGAVFDKVLVAVGRRPNGRSVGAEAAGVEVNDAGFIPVDDRQRTNAKNIYAIGDVVGMPMLAHKAAAEGKIAAEVIAGEPAGFDDRVIPSVAYTDPEIAWVGLSEEEASGKGIEVGVGKFPWAASGRSLTLGRSDGLTKLVFDKETGRLLGAGIVGTSAGDLISEAALAIEMGADAADIALTIHPHPTLGETIALAAEAYEGTITDLYMPKR